LGISYSNRNTSTGFVRVADHAGPSAAAALARLHLQMERQFLVEVALGSTVQERTRDAGQPRQKGAHRLLPRREQTVDDAGDQPPLLPLFHELSPSGGRDAVEARTAIVSRLL
jgi:hypothetical protein